MQTLTIEVPITDRTDANVIRTELQRAVPAPALQALADGSPKDTGRAWH